MANQPEAPLRAQDVGNAFVKQYCDILNTSPEDLHRFYEESSMVSRPQPDAEGIMSVTNVQGIDSKILCLDYPNYRDVKILTIDSQFSFKGGVIVLVTGDLIGAQDVRRKFTQTFFLAPQNTGYFVTNDIFKFVDFVDNEANNVVEENTPQAPLSPNHEPSAVVADQPVLSPTTSIEMNNTNGNEANNVVENVQETFTENIVVTENPVESRKNGTPQLTEAAPSNTQKDGPKTYASVVNALNLNKGPFLVRAPPTKPVAQPVAQPRPPVTPEALSPRNNSVVEKKNMPAVKAYAVFIANLPMNATVEGLEKVFKPYGAIKRDGIQVRSNKQRGTCFGFVDFESSNSMENALKSSSPIKYGDNELRIEERQANNDRGRFSSGRGGYRNDNFRLRENYGGENYSGGGRGNYGGGRGFGRNDGEKKTEYREFTGAARGNTGRNGEAYQRSYQNGGKAARQTPKVDA